MARTPRIKVPDEPTVYHIMSRTALDGYPLGDFEKDFLTNLIKQQSRLYFTEIIGFCCMGNHFHLLARMYLASQYTDQEVKERFKAYYGDDKELYDGQIPILRQKWADLSEFAKEIKQQFTRFYNKRHNRHGCFWGARFKSVIVEKGETLINCLAYIDLNPVRAGLVEKPEDYRWNSIGYHVQNDNKDNFLSLDFGLYGFGVKGDNRERLRLYRKFIYEIGALETDKGKRIDQEILKTEKNNDFELTRSQRFKYRTRYFSDSCIIGSKEYVQKNCQRFRDLFQSKNEKTPKRVKGLNGIYSLRRLTE